MTDHATEARRLVALIDDAADGDTLAAMATAHALLAIADRLGTPPAGIAFDTEPAPDTLNTEPGWTAPTTGTYQTTTGSEPRPICGTPNPGRPGMICDDVPHHYGVHDRGRAWWYNDPDDGHTPCPTPGPRACRLYAGHPGPCNHHDKRRS